jgi:hypothetical protein
MVVRCTECDLINTLSDESKQDLRSSAISDSASESELQGRLSHLLESFPAKTGDLLRNALFRTSTGRNYNWEQYDLCFLSEMTVAKLRDRLPETRELEHVDCGAFPQVLRVGSNPSITYLLLVPVGQGDSRKGHIAFESSVLGSEVVSQILKFEWYDPYDQKVTDRFSLDMTQSVFQWDDSLKILKFSSSDPRAGCYTFSLQYSLPSQPIPRKLRLEKSAWSYMCSTDIASGDLCPVPLFDAKKGFKGKLIKGKVACEQPNAKPSEWQKHFSDLTGIRKE